jgi:Na+-driven multidrug efflux pump
MLVRTAALRAALLLNVLMATSLGVVYLAAYQVASTVFNVLAFVLDATAIAAQALIAHAAGAGDAARVALIARRAVWWGMVMSLALAVVVGATSTVLPLAFTGDQAVRHYASLALLVLAVGLPVSGFVFVLDGVLMGAADSRYLAVASLVNLAVYVPALWLVRSLLPAGAEGMVGLMVAFAFVYMGARAATLGARIRGRRWIDRALAAEAT